MNEKRSVGAVSATLNGSFLASAILVSMIVLSGVAYSLSTDGGGGSMGSSSSLVVTSLTMTNSPSYVVFKLTSALPTQAATFKVGPFLPGDNVIVSYTVKNIGSLPLPLSTLGVSVVQVGNGFTATNGPIPPSLNPGASFSSTITITLKAGLGNSYEASTATVTLAITSAETTTTSLCTTTVTHTITKTSTITKTLTVTKTTTKGWDSPLGVAPLWLTTSCTAVTITVSTSVTFTQTSYVTTTKTVTHTTCAPHNDCE